MRFPGFLLAAALGLCVAVPAGAQFIGVLQSAETIDRGTFKLMAAPVMAFGKNGADDEVGLVARAGYGFSDRFDAEAKLGFFDHVTYAGADGEYWILKDSQPNTGLAFSLAAGLHWMFADAGRYDTMGIDLTPLLSGRVAEAIELCGALDASFETVADAPPGVDDTFTRVHLVPGVEYRLSATVDLVGEVGIALNDDSSTYLSAGVALYLR